MTRIPATLALVVVSFGALAQSSPRCEAVYLTAHKHYEQKKYAEALSVFQTVDTCRFTRVEFYNGACFASLSGNGKKAIEYLKKAVSLEYDDIKHMTEDKDLDPIRNSPGYKSVVKSIETRYDTMARHFRALAKAKPGIELIPYWQNGKWGWMDKATRKPLVKAMFSYTDFPSAGGVAFGYQGRDLQYTKDNKVKRIDNDADISVMFDAGLNPFPSKTMKGFKVVDTDVSEYSDKYNHVTLLNPWSNPGEYLGVASNRENKSGIIRENGDTLKGFAFNFAYITKVRTATNLYIMAMKPGEEDWKIYDLDGKLVFDEPIREQQSFGAYSVTDWSGEVFVGRTGFEYTRVLINNRWYVLNLLTMTKVNKEGYDHITSINGPTTYKDRTGSIDSPGIYTTYFLAMLNNEQFYFDTNGEVYRVK